MTPETRRHLLLLVLAVACLAGLVLQGCSTYPRQPTMTSPVNTGIEEVRLFVVWHESVESVHDRCWPHFRQAAMYYHGCSFAVRVKGRWECEVHATAPKDWNDLPALQILGHEVAHCYMARHD